MDDKKSKIEIRKRWGRNELYINDFPQSTSIYKSDWRKLLKLSGVFLKSNQRVLLLGMGGGHIITLLSKYQPTTKITTVEIMGELVEVAEKYFGIIQDEDLNIITADAKDYMKKNKDRFNLVIVDLYDGDDVPKFVSSQTFLTQIAFATEENGHAIFNYASHSFKKEDFDSFERMLSNVFDNVKIINIWGHTYYLANKL